MSPLIESSIDEKTPLRGFFILFLSILILASDNALGEPPSFIII